MTFSLCIAMATRIHIILQKAISVLCLSGQARMSQVPSAELKGLGFFCLSTLRCWFVLGRLPSTQRLAYPTSSERALHGAQGDVIVAWG